MLDQAPLSNHNLLVSHDLYETQETISGFMHPHRMRANHPQLLNTRLDGVPLGEMGLFYLHYGDNVSINLEENQRYYLFQMSLSGHARICQGKHCSETSAGTLTVLSPDCAGTIQMDAACSYLVLMLNRTVLERHLSQLLDKHLNRPILFDLELPDAGQNIALQQTLTYLCQQYNQPDNPLLNQPRITHQYREMICSLVLNIWRHNYSDALAQTNAIPQPWYIRRAAEYINDNINQPISIATLSKTLGITRRTLQNGFNHFLNQTPSGYILNLRLKQVRRALQQADPKQASITGIMLDHGINNPGRFAKIYKQRYGELPSETLLR